VIGIELLTIVAARSQIDVQPAAIREMRRLDGQTRAVDEAGLFRQKRLTRQMREHPPPTDELSAPLKARHRLGALDGAVVTVIGDEIGVARTGEMKRLAITLEAVALDGQLLGTRVRRLVLWQDRSQVDVAVGRIGIGDTQLRRSASKIARELAGGAVGNASPWIGAWLCGKPLRLSKMLAVNDSCASAKGGASGIVGSSSMALASGF
jgi:hypothetical protein